MALLQFKAEATSALVAPRRSQASAERTNMLESFVQPKTGINRA